MVQYINITSRSRSELIDITGMVEELVRKAGVSSGVCHLFSLHTTGAITVNEGADPSVQRDIAAFLKRLVPVDAGFIHEEGNSDAHVKTALAGPSQALIIEGGRLLLGTWQAIFFCEFDGPRSRKVAVKIVGDS
ncbi:MAG: secondary thiamine-phosphate synthase enzyme YjbQ [Geobacteraceae bacterium]|nr:secondary thiamine-phosphate synthase enzyme YjbQ [Geobacteraceae bacterium]